MRLRNKTAIITGSGSGIGRAAALGFAKEGASVCVADRNDVEASRTVGEIRAAGGDAFAVTADVSKFEDVARMVDVAQATWGRIDILVNNAGYGIGGTVVDTTEADWNALMATNVNGVFFGCKAVIPIMAAQGGGSIINTASAVSVVGIYDRAAYVASKGAVAALTRAMALDHADQKIRVNCVGAGTVESPYYDRLFAASPEPDKLRAHLEQRQLFNRLGRPEEIAAAMLFLASDESSFCTGSTLFADGGWTAR
ncbi:SDR family oxidoreductase [Xanthobacter dioxanivorans]|uniref:SDR family oxidoreductase n=1 Tax=Xanthobacter dioxanivorans TaxID=2528964 RepID=A0A974SJ20_9HYPH|nr:SDR family oxidoreductase [Xanthobacter dioxanivorans]QRG07042.1 SDR family oxidoreductase [Xanthobacter dioxanivorans]